MKPIYIKNTKAELTYISADMKSLIQVFVDEDFDDYFLDESIRVDILNENLIPYYVQEFDLSSGQSIYKSSLGGILDETPEKALEVYLSDYKIV